MFRHLHLELPILHPGLVPHLADRCRSLLDRTAADIEARPMPGALDKIADDLALRERAAGVRAGFGDGANSFPVLVEKDGRIAGEPADEHPVLELALEHDAGELLRDLLPGMMVDARPNREDQFSAEKRRGEQQSVPDERR